MKKSLADELESRVVCGDGAIGTLLLNDGCTIDQCLEELCLSEPERIRRIHEGYIAAGARVIKTNTFGANAHRLRSFGFEEKVREINRAAVAVAMSAAQNRDDVWIAGSVGPLGIGAHEASALRIDPAHCFREQLTALVEGGVHAIVFETFTDLAEMEIALRTKKALSDVVEICTFACGTDGQLRCGTMIIDAVKKLRELGAKIAGVNCMNDPRGMVLLLDRMPRGSCLAVYPAAGQPRKEDGRLLYDSRPESFAAHAGELIGRGARLIGGCCGTTPEHVAALAREVARLAR